MAKRGRPAGGKNRKTRELADAARAAGISPLEIMLNTARAMWDLAQIKDAKPGEPTLDIVKAQEASEMAAKCAPYCHPRLNAIEGGDPNKPVKVDVDAIPDDEGARICLFALRLGAVAAGKKNR